MICCILLGCEDGVYERYRLEVRVDEWPLVRFRIPKERHMDACMWVCLWVKVQAFACG